MMLFALGARVLLLIAPFVSARIGGWLTNKTNKVRVVSSRVNPIDTVEISIPAEGVGAAEMQKFIDDLALHIGTCKQTGWQRQEQAKAVKNQSDLDKITGIS